MINPNISERLSMKKLYGLLSIFLLLSIFNNEGVTPWSVQGERVLVDDPMAIFMAESCSFYGTAKRTETEKYMLNIAKKFYKKLKAKRILCDFMTDKKSFVFSSYIVKELGKIDQIKRLQFKDRYRITNHAHPTIKTRCSGTE